jgi:hypothetical protein
MVSLLITYCCSISISFVVGNNVCLFVVSVVVVGVVVVGVKIILLYFEKIN